MCEVDFALLPARIDPTIPPPISSGIRIVEMRKALVRTRSRYSRFAMSHTLCIDFISYSLNKNLFQRWLHHLKTGDAGFGNSIGQKRLSIAAFVQLDLGHTV